MNFRMIKNILGWILIFEAGFMLVPLLTAIIYSEEVFTSYLISMGICLLIGFLFIWGKPKDKTLYSREGFVIVSLSWIFLSIFGALPMFISREIPSYIDALFETVSGFTTTGASIVPDVEALSHATLIWRSFTHCNVKNVLTAEEAAQYTVKNVLSGSDNWQPSIITESCAAPQAKIEGNKIVWDAVPYAICYVVYKNDEVAGFTTECEFAYEAGAEYKVFAANEQGGLSKASVPGVTDGISSLPTADGQQPTAIYTLDGKRVQQLQQGINIIKTANGEVKKIIK